MRAYRTLCAFLILTLAAPSLAGSRLDGFETRGDMLGWEAVGRLDLPNGFCTGVLVGKDTVVTAAHCLFERRSAERVDLGETVFRAGYLNGVSLFERRVVSYEIAPGFSYSGPRMQAEEAARDVALLRLDRPVSPSEARPFFVFDGAGSVSEVAVMSYGRGRAEAMSYQRACNVTRQNQSLWEFDCDTTFGSSGAPVFARVDGRFRILSLVSGHWQTDAGEHRVIGMKLPAVLADIARARRATGVTVGRGAKRLIVGQESVSSGAKFLKP